MPIIVTTTATSDPTSPAPELGPVYPLVQFVTSRDTRTVRYDLQANAWVKVLAADFSLGVPQMQGAPGDVGVEWSYRKLTLTQSIDGTKADCLPLVAALAKEIVRPKNWLLFQLSATSPPMWFRTYATQPGEIDLDEVYNEELGHDIFKVQVQLDADPWGYGKKVTCPAVVVTNDPTTPVTPIPAPSLSVASIVADSSASLVTGTWFYVVTAITSAGETVASNRVSAVCTASRSVVNLTWNAVPGARAYQLYRGAASGQEKLFAAVGGAQTSFAENGAYPAQTASPPATNTTAGSPAAVVLPPVLGDAPTPLIVKVTPTVSLAGCQVLLNATPMPASSAYSGPIVWPASAFTNQTDTTTGTADPFLYFGGTYANVSFGTRTDMVNRFTGAVPVTPPIGRYKVLARVGRSDTASTFGLSLGQFYGDRQAIRYGPTVVMDRAASPAGNFTTYVDLGDFTFPMGVDPDSINPTDGVSTSYITLAMSRLSGTGAARVNGLVLIPVNLAGPDTDPTTLLSAFMEYGPNPARAGVWDGEKAQFMSYDGGANLSQGVAPTMSGGYPMATPGGRNVLHVLHQTLPSTPVQASVDNTDQIGGKATVEASYYPRWLWVAGS